MNSWITNWIKIKIKVRKILKKQPADQESGDWKNGLFTYVLLNGVQSGEADLNKDGEIWLSEIQEYVGSKVTELSNGQQQPTSRIENQLVDFRVW